jgi:hypothetical protein
MREIWVKVGTLAEKQVEWCRIVRGFKVDFGKLTVSRTGDARFSFNY